MKPGVIAATVLTLAGLGAVVFAFQSNSSQYVSIKEAKATAGNRHHLSGSIVPGSMHSSAVERKMTFMIKDEAGDTMPVVYNGMPPANIAMATMVVAVGGAKNGTFEAEEIITKCPSKYESTK